MKEIKTLENKIKNIEKSIENLQKGIENVKKDLEQRDSQEQETDNILWKPTKKHNIYYCVDLDYMTVDSWLWCDDESDNIRYNHKVIFETKRQAEEYLDYLNAKEQAMNEFSGSEWRDDELFKYNYLYIPGSKEFMVTGNYIHKCDIPYFRTAESCKDFIDKYEWQIKRDLGVE